MSLHKYAPLLTRYAVSLVFLLIGLDQLIKPELWASYFPQTLPFGITVAQAVMANGIGDVLIGLVLAIGLFTRIVASLAVLHLIGVMLFLGYNDITIRDAGITLAALSTAFYGSDAWSLDAKLKRK